MWLNGFWNSSETVSETDVILETIQSNPIESNRIESIALEKDKTELLTLLLFLMER